MGEGASESSFLEKIVFYRMASSSPRAFLKSLRIPENEFAFEDETSPTIRSSFTEKRGEVADFH